MNIAECLQIQAQARPADPAIIDSIAGHERIISFAELQSQVTRAAALLWQSGLRPGDKVLIFQPMSAELYVALIALFRLGLVAMFIDPSAGLTHIERCCALQSPQAFVGNARAYILHLLSPSLRSIARKFVIGASFPGAISWSSATWMHPYEDIYQVDTETPALLTFTSGSTGQPRAALRTHTFLLAQQRVLEHHFGEQAGAVSLTTMPIFVLADLASGVTSLIAAGNLRKPGSIEPEPVLKQIERYHPVRAGASPAFWERIIAYCHSQHRQIPHLRSIYVGGAPVFPRILDGLQKLAPQAEIIAIYGSTEAEPVAHLAYKEIGVEERAAMFNGRGLLVGSPVPEIQVRILSEHERQTPVLSASAFEAACASDGVPGEIVVSGAHVLPGYLHGQDNEETKIHVEGNLWHRSGDMGYLDSKGRLWLLGRRVACMRDRRGILYPLAVECAVSAHSAVRRAAAMSVREQRILVLEFVRSGSRPGREAIRQLVAWADFDAYLVCGHLPVDKRHNAKIDYPALRSLLERPSNLADSQKPFNWGRARIRLL